jgi:hypothetical protein
MAESEPTKDFKPYHYDPSLAAASISAILFLTTSSVHVWQMFKHKTWFFVAFIIGGLCKKEAPSTLPGHFPLPRWEKMLTASTSRVHRLCRAGLLRARGTRLHSWPVHHAKSTAAPGPFLFRRFHLHGLGPHHSLDRR